MKRAYINKSFQGKTQKIIETANTIIDEYKADGYDLTLRQLYYQFVARDIIPNKQSEYNKLGTAINNGRLAGLIDWNSIVDRTRRHEANAHWDSPSDIINDSADQYAIDTRADQNDYLEVWVEKDALVGVIERACEPLDIGYLSCRGYVSQSAMWRAGMRFKRQEQNGKDCTVLLHLGDHDPSGIDMTRDIQDRLTMFGSDVEVKRIALGMEQVEEYSQPPNPAKTTDSRYASYVSEYGDESWELDALEPRYLSDLIRDQILEERDEEKWEEAVAEQERERDQIDDVIERWNELFEEGE